MPAYNAEKFIAETIHSILFQNFKNFELLIYNDASSDNTLNEISKIVDSRIKVFEGKINMGVSAARNFLLSKAKGDFIAFFDSDDISLKNKFSFCISFLINRSEIDLVGSKTYFINDKSKTIRFIKTFESFSSEDIKADLLFNNTFSTSSIIFKKKILPLIKFDINVSIAEDYLLFSNLSDKIKMANINKKLLKYRVNPNSLMFKNKNNLKKSLDNIHETLLKSLGINTSPELIEIHNKFIYSSDLDLIYLEKNLNLYKNIIQNNHINKVYDNDSLLRSIRKNWFLKCLYCSRSTGKASLTYYFFRFPYHNFSILKFGLILILYNFKKSLKI